MKEIPFKLRFTLIELLVVVAIITILMSLLLPSLAKTRALARGMSCSSQERQVLTAVFNYGDSNNSYGPGIGNTNHIILDSSRISGTLSVMHSNLLPYLNMNYNVFHCPSDSGDARFWRSSSILGVNYATSYGHSILRPSGEISGAWCDTFPWSPFKFPVNNQLASVYTKTPSKVAFIGDASWVYTSADKLKWQYHSRGYNVGFLDGHVACHRAELYGNAWNAGFYRTNW